ncbi:MAG: outer membrane beta-barrel family protein, partial [Mucilaginibacter sp.]
NQGKYTRSNNALNINYKTSHFNVFGNIGYGHDANFSDQTYSRYFSDRSILQNSFYDYHSNSYSGRAGIDYLISPKTTLGVILTGSTRPKSDQLNYTGNQYNNSMQLDSIGKGKTTGNYLFQNLGVNINLQHKFDDKGQVLSINVDQLNYHSTSNQLSPLDIYLPNGNLASDQQRVFTQPSDVHIYAAKADYTHPLPGNAEFDAGAKSSYVNNDNQSGWFNQIGVNLIPDYNKTDHFKYNENINSAYVNIKKEWKYWTIQSGLRLENTNAKGHQFSNPATPDAAFTKHYTSLFPSFFLLHKLDSMGDNTLLLSYSKRIRRPSYGQLNPFLFYQDQYSYNSGNPGLLPSFTQYVELKYSYKQYFGLTLSYGGGNNGISPVTQDNGDVLITSPLNFVHNRLYGIIPYVSLNPVAWWTVNLNAVILFQSIKGTANGVNLDQRVNTHEIETTNQFKISKTWSAELDGFFPGKQTYAQSSNDAIYNISAGLQKTILSGQGTIRFNANDIFDKLTLHSQTLGINGVTAYNSRQTDSRWVGLSFTYRFGKAANARKHNDSGSAEDEKGRTN